MVFADLILIGFLCFVGILFIIVFTMISPYFVPLIIISYFGPIIIWLWYSGFGISLIQRISKRLKGYFLFISDFKNPKMKQQFSLHRFLQQIRRTTKRLKIKEIQSILEHYNLGSLKSYEDLESGYYSDNYCIYTDTGKFVLKILYESEKTIQYIMNIYEYLVSQGIKTAKPKRTQEKKLYLVHNNRFIIIQTFLEGKPELQMKKIERLLAFYGKELGNIHSISKKIDQDNITMFRDNARTDCLNEVKHLAEKYLPKNMFFKKQFNEWVEEVNNLPLKQLSQSVIHGDCGPKDFLFKDGKFVGVLDFQGGNFDYLLYDLAISMIYFHIFKVDRSNKFSTFIIPYLKKSSLKLEELKWLTTFLKCAFFYLVLIHQYRYDEGITQGVDFVEDNLKGVKDGITGLKALINIPKDFYFKVLEKF